MCMNCCMVLQIYIDECYIGGFDDLFVLDCEGGLVLLLVV